MQRTAGSDGRNWPEAVAAAAAAAAATTGTATYELNLGGLRLPPLTQISGALFDQHDPMKCQEICPSSFTTRGAARRQRGGRCTAIGCGLLLQTRGIKTIPPHAQCQSKIIINTPSLCRDSLCVCVCVWVSNHMTRANKLLRRPVDVCLTSWTTKRRKKLNMHKSCKPGDDEKSANKSQPREAPLISFRSPKCRNAPKILQLS